MSQVGSINEMAKRYEGQAQFLFIYIKEAHPSDDWASQVNDRLTYIKDPVNFFARTQVANTCVNDMLIDFPCLVDDMDNTATRAYKAWPDRLYVVARDGTLAYVGQPGPRGLLPDEMEAALKKELVFESAHASPRLDEHIVADPSVPAPRISRLDDVTTSY